ncbi:helix-turn-helix domain-containing protein [Burkholderia sp. Ax-1719]|jgi:hypothetical protein|uniref:helix-turn-helix domain-containing protein n=1 Tax=Burkholderia sp. Ax-1719 TaxID=2608334 RepID=UPI00141F75AA|nr:helix-turn-helix domain-containing protein [Burkholderia sp. Ax-1719]NIE64109.1 helix-turn-helix domain-containing protein [Burkholderia sp. Ax-1719]
MLTPQSTDAYDAVLIARGIERSLTTEEAAAALNRRPQTLRKWACLENGPIRPVRICGRLAWRISDIQRLLSEGA